MVRYQIECSMFNRHVIRVSNILFVFFTCLMLIDYTGNADMPYDFFLSRYTEAYVTETVAFCESLVNDSEVPCTGQDGLAALIMALAADKSAAENRWVPFREIVESVYCENPLNCELLPVGVFPKGFQPVGDVKDLLTPDVDTKKKAAAAFG